MALMDFIKRQLIDIIEWTDDSRDTLSFRFPDDDKEIKRGAQLIVRESQVVAVRLPGQFGDMFGPGKHTLTTDNIPILTDLKGWKYGFESPFKADVYYVITRLFTGNKWGTSNPVMMRDADFGIVRAARVRHLRFPHRRSAAVPEGSGRHRSHLPARRVRRHDAVAAGQRVQRRARRVEDSGARLATRYQRARRRAAAADQSDRAGRSTAWRSPASCSRTCRCRRKSKRRSTSAPAWRDRQPERLREVSDGRRHGQRRQLRRRSPPSSPSAWPSRSR